MKQTFTKYLPCARLWTIYTKTIIKKAWSLPSWSSQSVGGDNHKHSSKAPGRHNEEGLVLQGGCRAGFTEMETMELGLG